MWLTRLALRNPILILMLALATVVLGLQSLLRLSVDLFPDITIPVIRVVTFYPGAGPADIEKAITVPVERAVAASPGIDRIESTSRQGTSIVSAWFSYGVNLDNAQFEVQQRVSQVLNTLPPGIQQPFIIKFDVANIPVLTVAISSDTLDEKQLYDLAFNVIEPQLERVRGIASANPGGGKQREIEVEVERDALRARGLGILDVVSAVRSSNLLLPSGNLKTGDRDMNVFSNTQVHNPRELAEVIVQPGQAGPQGQSGSSPGSGPVRLSDVASVSDGTADQQNIVRVSGVRGVYIRLLKQPQANTIAVVDAVRAQLPKLTGVPESVKLVISFDQSTYIRNAVTALEHEALQGGGLAVLVILIFLLSLRATGIVAVAIPLSIIATFVLMYFAGQSLNVFTLGGLALGVGRLVDDSIVELENIHRHLATEPTRKQAVLKAAQEVAMPILVSTITTIVVFFPVLFLTGVARYLFIPLALTISFSLLMSFFVSRTVTPLLCLYWLKKPDSHHHQEGSGVIGGIGRALEGMDALYARMLSSVLRHRALTIVVILALCGATVPLYFRIGSEFFPQTDESQFTLSFKAPIGTRVERSEEIALKLEQAADEVLLPKDGSPPKYVATLSDIGLPGGRTAIFTSNTGPHAGNIQFALVPRGERRESDTQLVDKLRAVLREKTAGIVTYFFTGGIVKRILTIGQPAPVDIEILGQDQEIGAAYAKKVLGKLHGLQDQKGRPLLTDLLLTREENYPELHIEVDRQKAGVLGISEQQVAQSVLTTLTGNSQFLPIRYNDPETGNEYFINVRMSNRYRDEIDDIRDIFIRSPLGGLVALSSVAKIERQSGPVQISRKYLQRVVDVTASVAATTDLGTASDAVERALRELPPPEGFAVKVSGQREAQQQAFSGLLLSALLAVVLVYMVLASQFKSLLQPVIIMMSVPLGLAGVMVSLFVTGTTLSVNSFMGIIMMVGIVVSNGVLLVDYANVRRQRGEDLVTATVHAGRTRLRPILMTTIATIVGLIPMALGIGEGSETNLPLARAVIGGLTVSTAMTLLLIPVLYSLLGNLGMPGEYDDLQ